MSSFIFAPTDQELRDHIDSLGTVISAKVMADRFTEESRGFGFVEMSAQEEAEHAINALHGTDFGGRFLAVNEARPLKEKHRLNSDSPTIRSGGIAPPNNPIRGFSNCYLLERKITQGFGFVKPRQAWPLRFLLCSWHRFHRLQMTPALDPLHMSDVRPQSQYLTAPQGIIFANPIQ